MRIWFLRPFPDCTDHPPFSGWTGDLGCFRKPERRTLLVRNRPSRALGMAFANSTLSPSVSSAPKASLPAKQRRPGRSCGRGSSQTLSCGFASTVSLVAMPPQLRSLQLFAAPAKPWTRPRTFW